MTSRAEPPGPADTPPSPTPTSSPTSTDTLTATNAPTSTTPATTNAPNNTTALARSANGFAYKQNATANATLNTDALLPNGGSQPHNNMSPFLVMSFIIALVGPISSIIIAALFFGLWYGMQGINEAVAAIARYLSIINAILALFNMVPGFPLDGGRVLRAIAWKVTGNLKRATRIASITGQVIAFLLIFFGISQILRGLFFNGLWIALIGWFIHSAAVRGYRQVLMKETIKDVRAKDLMDTAFETIDGSISVQELMEDHILTKKERSFLVTEGGMLAGIVCLEDVKAIPPQKRMDTEVREIMTPREKLEAVAPEADGNQVLARLARGRINQVPVVQGGEIKGLVCRTDILDFIHLRSELGM